MPSLIVWPLLPHRGNGFGKLASAYPQVAIRRRLGPGRPEPAGAALRLAPGSAAFHHNSIRARRRISRWPN